MNLNLRCVASWAAWAAFLSLTACTENQSVETGAAQVQHTTVDSAALLTDSARMGKAGGVEVGGAAMTPDKTIFANVSGSKECTTLVAALKAAGLEEKLAGEGPFTVFAPSNAAFQGLPNGAMAGLLKPESKDKLKGVLTYHVIASRLVAADLQDGQQLTTVNGEKVKISVKHGQILVNNAAIATPDIVSRNGVIHLVDQVLLPPAPGN